MEIKKRPLFLERAFRHVIAPYDCVVYFYITQDIKLAHKQAKLKFTEGSCAEDGGECHHEFGYRFYVFLNHQCLTHAYIGHELAHASHAICRQVGIEPSFENDEAEAYIFYALHGFLYKKLEQLGLKVTHKPSKQ